MSGRMSIPSSPSCRMISIRVIIFLPPIPTITSFVFESIVFEDLLNSSSHEIIFDAFDPPTYLHYNGSGSNPDLLCVSSHLSDYSKRRVIEDPSSGHRQNIASIVLPGSERKK
ncbi:uncharacterized protein NPIL_10311 [Nephila pilipes]|uniref:Uncharacterized protein n=1 Tax=Nephila pilipes TaxID=299642 RepID=A0A8X6TG26_NEPPI|nr:uncharacterized protein NPIL_10311 [Nephila pilipes]